MDALSCCQDAQELFALYQTCASRRQIDTLLQNYLDTMQAVKAYRPETNSFSTGQVFQCAYDFRKARVVIREMADAAALDLVSKWMVTDQLVMTVGYDIECLTDPAIRCRYHGPITTDATEREVPKSAMVRPTSPVRLLPPN